MADISTLSNLNFANPYTSARSPAMGRAAIATSQPLASLAGLGVLEKGGTAVDAALAAAMVLTVVEPTGCGIGSDAFAIVHDGDRLHGLNSSGRAPAAWRPDTFAGMSAVPERGWGSVTVPGAVAGWIALWRKFGRLPLFEIAYPAIRYAQDGFQVTPIIAALWAQGAKLLKGQPGFAECFMPGGRPPRPGELFRSPAHAATLIEIVETEGASFYGGRLAEAIASDAKANGAAMTLEDLASHQAEWVAPMSTRYAGAVVHELPPNGQGVATLISLGLLEAAGLDRTGPDDVDNLHACIEATKLALADLDRHVGDRDHMRIDPAALIDPDYLVQRARLIDVSRAGEPRYGEPRRGGTVCLAAADHDGMMVSFIQSNYMGFGSGVVVPKTGVSLQNRGASFNLVEGHPNQAGPRKRPFHTIIPGFVTALHGAPLMAFGLMGGPMQAQGHVQLANRILRHGQNPQAAADAPRWRVIAGRRLAVEPSMPRSTMEGLTKLGHELTIERPDESFAFGGAQIVCRTEFGYVAGSDPRKDGAAAAF